MRSLRWVTWPSSELGCSRYSLSTSVAQRGPKVTAREAPSSRRPTITGADLRERAMTIGDLGIRSATASVISKESNRSARRSPQELLSRLIVRASAALHERQADQKSSAQLSAPQPPRLVIHHNGGSPNEPAGAALLRDDDPRGVSTTNTPRSVQYPTFTVQYNERRSSPSRSSVVDMPLRRAMELFGSLFTVVMHQNGSLPWHQAYPLATPDDEEKVSGFRALVTMCSTPVHRAALLEQMVVFQMLASALRSVALEMQRDTKDCDRSRGALVDQLLTEMESKALATAGKASPVRERCGATSSSSSSKTPRRSRLPAVDSLNNVLKRITLQLYLVHSLLQTTDSAGKRSAAPSPRRVAYMLLDNLHTRAYVLHDVRGHDGVSHTVRLHSLDGLMTHVMQKLHTMETDVSGVGRGLDSVAQRRAAREVSNLHEQWTALLNIYMGLLPHVAGSGAYVNVQCHCSTPGGIGTQEQSMALKMLRTVQHGWRLSRSQVRMQGAIAGIAWLPLVPLYLNTYTRMAQVRMLRAAGESNEVLTSPEAQAWESNVLGLIHACIAETLHDLLHMDRRVHERRRAVSCDRIAAEGTHPATGESAAEEHDKEADGDKTASPRRRLRGKRSLFYKDDSKTSVLRIHHDEEPMVERKANRFVSRHGGGEHGGRVSQSSSRQTEKDGTSSEASALFQVLVLSADAVPVLTQRYGLDAPYVGDELEGAWLELVQAARAVRLLFGPRPKPDAASSIASLEPDGLPGLSGRRVVEVVGAAEVAALLEGILPREFFDRVQRSLSTVGPTESALRWRSVLSVLHEAQVMFHDVYLDSLLHVINTLGTVLIRIFHNSRAVCGTTALSQVQQRRMKAISAVLSVGAETLLQDDASQWCATSMAWRVWSAPPSAGGPAQWVFASALAVQTAGFVRAGATMTAHHADSLCLTAMETLRCLRACSAGRVSLSLHAKQSAAACVLCSLSTAAVHSHQHTAVKEGLDQLLEVLELDKELLLLCCYPAYLNMLWAAFDAVGRPGDKLRTFGRTHIAPVVIPVVSASLYQSSVQDSPRSHAALCERTLLLLAELARYYIFTAPEEGVGAVWYDHLMRLVVFGLRYAGRGGLKQASALSLPPTTLPRIPLPFELEQCTISQLGLIAPVDGDGRRDGACGQGHLMHLLDQSNALLPASRLRPAHRSNVNDAVRALEDYLSAMPRVSFSEMEDLCTSTDTPEGHGNGHGATDVSVMAQEVGHRCSGVQRWYQLLSPALVAGAKQLPFCAHSPFKSHQLSYLVVCADQYLRIRERLVHIVENTQAAPSGPSLSPPVDALTVQAGTQVMALFDDTPLVTLDFVSHLSAAGNWSMVYWSLSIAETAMRVALRRQRSATLPLQEAAVLALISQLRVLPPPNGSFSQCANLTRSLVSLSDCLARVPSNLLGFDRRSPLVGLLAFPSRDAYRAVCFAVKQAVVYLQADSVPYCRRCPVGHPSEMMLLEAVDDDAPEASADTIHGEVVDDADVDVMRLGTAATPPAYYRLARRTGNASAPTSAASLAHRGASQEALPFVPIRKFLIDLLSSLSVTLECVRSHVLREGIVEEDLRRVLAVSVRSLCRLLAECMDSYLALPIDARMEHYATEHTDLLWVGMCAAASLGRLVLLDRSGSFFIEQTSREIITVCSAVERLAEERVANTRTTEFATTATVTESLIRFVASLVADPRVPRGVANQLGLMEGARADLSTVLRAILTLAVSTNGYDPSAQSIQVVWRAIQREVCSANDHLRSVLKVHAKSDLVSVLEAFNAHPLGAPAAEAAKQMDWSCNVQQMVAMVQEDASAQLHLMEVTDEAPPSGMVDLEVPHLDPALQAHPTATRTRTSARRPHSQSPPEMELHVGVALQEAELSKDEVIDAVIEQSCYVVRLVGGRRRQPLGTPSALASHTQRLLYHLSENLLQLIDVCTLAEIACRPCADQLFASMGILADERWPSAGGCVAQAHSQERRATLWALLAKKWQAELIDPHTAVFRAHQDELLDAVRKLRSLDDAGTLISPKGRGASGSAAGGHVPKHDIFAHRSEIAIVSGLGRRVASGLGVTEAYDLPRHDDVREIWLREAGTPSSESSSTKPARSYQAGGLLTPVLPCSIPLGVLVALLGAMLQGSPLEEPLRDLAEVVCIYAARQYILLRPRLDGTALNLIPLVSETVSSGDSLSDSAAADPLRRLLLRLHLPLLSTHAEEAAGFLFADAERAMLSETFRIVGWVEPSVEVATFQYLRHGAVYLHVIALVASVLCRYHILGTMELPGAGLVTRGLNREADGASSLISTLGPRPDRSSPLDGSLQRDLATARGYLRDAQHLCLARQTRAEEVNRNLLESVLLHFLNISWNMLRHSDAITHAALDRVVALSCRSASNPQTNSSDHRAVKERGTMLLAFADELRVMVAAAFKTSTAVIMRQAARSQVRMPHRVMQSLLGGFSGSPLPLEDGRRRPMSAAIMTPLLALRQERPELLVGSPTHITLVTPSYFAGHMVRYVRGAPSAIVTSIASCFAFHLTRRRVLLAPLLIATTELISATYIRSTMLRMYCESLAKALMERHDFRQALVPATVASVDTDTAGIVTNEVLILFLAAITRSDVQVTKGTLAALLHGVLRMRPDVFGPPPTDSRQGKLTLVRPSPVGGSFESHNPLYDDRLGKANGCPPTAHPSSSSTSRSAATGPAAEDEDMATLGAFTMERTDTMATTHQRALAGLAFSLPVAMELAMHLHVGRRLTREEYQRATSLIRVADDARRERITTHRSLVYAVPGDGGQARADVDVPLDASLHLEDPEDYGVAILHVQFALRKVVHAAFRRLGRHQSAVLLADMVHILCLVDPHWRSTPRDGNTAQQRDSMLEGTLRVLMARAVVCAQGIGYGPTGSPLRLSSYGEEAAPPLLLPPPPSTAPIRPEEDDNHRMQRMRLEADAAVAVANSVTSYKPADWARVRRSLRLTMAAHEQGMIHRKAGASSPLTSRQPKRRGT